MKPAISSVSKRYGAGVRNQARNWTTSRQVDYNTKNLIVQRQAPILGAEKPPRYIGSGVQGQGNPPAPMGPRAGTGGAPQVGGGQVAKSQNPHSGQKTTGTSTNPYGATKPVGKSQKDALTNALLQKILKDREDAKGAVKRDPETKKISEVDLEKAKMDEKVKNELAKLSDIFKKDAKEMHKSIDDFQKRFEKNLKGSDATDKGKELNGILDEVKDNLRINEEGKVTDKEGNEIGSRHYNPQGLMDAAEKLQNWIDNPDNADELAKYGEEGQALKDLNDIIQQVGNGSVEEGQPQSRAKEYIGIVENNAETSFRAAEISANNAQEEAGRLKETLGGEATKTLSDDAKAKLDNFIEKMDTAMETINPGEDKRFEVKDAEASLGDMKIAYNELKEAAADNNEFAQNFEQIDKSFSEVFDLGSSAVAAQKHARTMVPDDDKYRQRSEEVVDKIDGSWREHRTKPERETDTKSAINNNQFLQEQIEKFNEENAAKSEEEVPKPKNESPDEATSRLGVDFDGDDNEADEQTTVSPEQVESQIDTALDRLDSSDAQAIDNSTGASSRSDAEAVDLDETTEELDQELEEMAAELEEDIEEMMEELDEVE
jgi:hypothetical protein